MLDIIALSYNDLPPVVPVRGAIPDEGGTIGRDSENTLVLPDPARLVSRKHARFLREGDAYVIANVSDGNPFYVNDQDVTAGTTCRLADGDLLQMGGYVLRIRVSGQPANGVAPATSLASELPAPSAPPTAGLPSAAPQKRSAPTADLLGTGSGALPGPFDDLLGTPVAPPSELFRTATPMPAAAAAVPAPIIPPDFDPFGPTGPAKPVQPAPSADPNDPGFSEVMPRLSPFAVVAEDPQISDNTRLDSLVAEKVERLSVAPDAHDPLALFKDESRDSPLLDGLEIADAESKPMAQATDFNAAFRPPVGQAAAPAAAMPTPVVEPAPAAAPCTAVSAAPAEAAPALADVAAPGPAPAAAIPSTQREAESGRKSEPVPVSSPPATTPGRVADDDELRRAFEEGLKAPLPTALAAFDAEAARLIGTLLRIAINGTLDLMRARSVVKKEIRVEMTVIEPADNNPLKFSPDVDVAIQYLFGRKLPGFLGPADAMAEAYADLSSHQLGMVAGMRSGMEDIIRRFDPAKIETEVANKRLLSKISRAHSRADLWDAYCARYQGIADALGNDFQDFYAKAFTRAYEEEVGGRSDTRSLT